MSLNAISESDIKKYKKIQKRILEHKSIDNNQKTYIMIHTTKLIVRKERINVKVSVTEAVRMIMNRAGKSMAQISREAMNNTPAAFVNMVNRGSMKMGVGAVVGDACGYTLMYVPNSEVGKIENGIEIKGEVYE